MTNPGTSSLDGIKVLDLTEERGQYTGRFLADLGADVIKIEKPGGSRTRQTGPFKDDIPRTENSLYFIHFNTSKRGVTLNLESPAGREIFKKLVARTDVVIEDFKVGYIESLGLDYPVLREINPRLVYASLTGFGKTGPYSHYKASDMVNFALSGQMYISGSPSEPPVVAPCDQSFHSGSVVMAFTIMAALFMRLSTGEGQQVDVSIHEVLANFSQAVMRYSVGSSIGERPGSQFDGGPSRIYPCKDGYVHILAFYPHHWLSFLDLLGNPPELTDSVWLNAEFRKANRDMIDPLVIEFASDKTKGEITALCQDRGIPCVPVNNAKDISQDAHFIERNSFKKMEHAAIGEYTCLNPPYRLSETPGRISRPSPLLGEHNADVYGEELGLGQEELAKLAAQGVI